MDPPFRTGISYCGPFRIKHGNLEIHFEVFWVVWDPQIIQYFSFFMGKLMVLGCTNLENTHLFTDEWTWGVYPRLRPAGDKPVDHRWFQGFVYSTPTSHEISWSLHSPWIWNCGYVYTLYISSILTHQTTLLLTRNIFGMGWTHHRILAGDTQRIKNWITNFRGT